MLQMYRLINPVPARLGIGDTACGSKESGMSDAAISYAGRRVAYVEHL